MNSFLIIYVVVMFLITTAWKGNFIAMLAVTVFPEKIHTFEELNTDTRYKVRFLSLHIPYSLENNATLYLYNADRNSHYTRGFKNFM